ncbi:hypothetical protein [Spirosoma foliorum]|uniref:Uncharacterized protein n=1 Tax=Spirosoma foliorum TaxID=2710596 RepID=A0A7G5GYQ0_9BACT|nr:hypothetical protein [Spirosoma foliorum]QMW03992.1 hypothetical protein H3H32_03275 [Spirosoma foliorum]
MLLRRLIALLAYLLRSFLTGSPVNSTTHFITVTRRKTFAWVYAVALLLYAHAGQAQFEPVVQQNDVEIDSSRGYWQLTTQASTRSTMVQFFGPDHHLLYEEIMPEKWVKLSRRNQKQFDQLLAKLVANQLLTDRIKTEALPPTPTEPEQPRVSVKASTSSYANSTVNSYLVHAYINQTGKLYLIVDNPDRYRYMVKVIDQGGQSLYEEFTNHDRYRRRLDLSSLPNDAYQVVVQIDNKPFVYKLKRQTNRMAYSLQSPSALKPQPVVEPNRADNERLLMPVSIDL